MFLHHALAGCRRALPPTAQTVLLLHWLNHLAGGHAVAQQHDAGQDQTVMLRVAPNPGQTALVSREP